MFAAINIESLVMGKELMLIVLGLCVVFVACFVMGIVSIGKARKVVKTKQDHDDLLRKNSALSTQRDSLNAEIGALRDQREEMKHANKFLEMNPHLVAENEKLEKSIADKELKLEQLNAEMKGVQDKKKELEKAEEDLRKISRDIADLEKDKTTITAERDAVKKELAEQTRKFEEIKSKRDALVDEIDKLKREVDKLKRDIDTMKREKEEAEKWLAANQDKIRNREDLDRQIAQKQDEVKRLDEKIKAGTDSLAGTMDRIDKGLDRLNKMNLSGVQTLRQNAFKSLQEGVFSITGRTAAANESEQDALKAVAEHIKASKFVVPERLLNAFHTSLKTSDMSSLTVMAGVSGTGKSAIPKLYSEAMGIHFQPLAVEPRWDSPKDLLGFFNYVTNRYEPTTLARALFQFQGLNGKAFQPDVDMQEYMLMPMLDEMNLARIEYYFSEFLSKLEMRRLVAPLTRENLGVVALEIFQGWEDPEKKQPKEEPIRLFANQNTLFVGTMNEDETTQSLSDKVIDRANVLYFGRPAKLQDKAGGAGHSISFQPLKKATWDSWHQKASEGELKFAMDILDRLNKTLADFNRPFAHRTFQAMLSYIANYPVKPGEDKDAVIKRALADQIGMRIMPKLYGVDLALHQETFTQVGSMLHEVDDKLLRHAFENASDRSLNKSGFFHWTGFDWSGDNS